MTDVGAQSGAASGESSDPSVLRWGILSTARIAQQHLIPAIAAAPNSELVAIGSRDKARADALGAACGVDRCYGSYEELLADPDVDAIYNPLPNHLHAPLTLQAAEAGKHVLCEKPFTMDLAEAKRVTAELAAIGNGVQVMEGFMYQFHPQWRVVLEMVRAGKIGRVVAIQTWFSYFGDDPSNIRHKPEWGGGALMDIGCYAIHSARRLFDAEPTRVRGSLEIHKTYQVDVTASALLDFPDGQATFTVATQSDSDQRVHIIGTEGRIEMSRPFNAQADQSVVVRVGYGMGETYGQPLGEVLSFGPANQYALMVEQFADAIAAGRPAPVSLDDALANMAVIDAVRDFRTAELT